MAVAITTLLPGAPWVPSWLVWVLFGLVFPLFGSTAIEHFFEDRHRLAGKPMIGRWRYRLPGRDSKWPPELLAAVPVWLAVVVGGLSLALWFLAMSGILLSKGQPLMIHGRYFAGSHGSLTALTKAGYDHQVALTQRSFVSIAAFVLLITTAVCWRDLRPDQL